jgi:hypothetical protein
MLRITTQRPDRGQEKVDYDSAEGGEGRYNRKNRLLSETRRTALTTHNQNRKNTPISDLIHPNRYPSNGLWANMTRSGR